MPEFYHDLITEKSFRILRDFKKEFDFILIGGWAVFLYAKALKSKDIDIILDYDQLEKIRQKFTLVKNERLKKYEIKIEEIDIDIYAPYFSDLGLPVEEIKKYYQSREGFHLPLAEILLILKVYAASQRKGTSKGRKDLIDIFSLILRGKIDWGKYKGFIKQYGLEYLSKELKNLVFSAGEIPELDLSAHRISRIKKEILAEI
ncbi:MAG: hypothetical protein V1732_04415 [Patescibacteria group bacterium]|nr:hypothetical protein [Patescibacteria group bacterium]MBU4141916.1 hypothetical protein [Patescibacteria group bacterium]